MSWSPSPSAPLCRSRPTLQKRIRTLATESDRAHVRGGRAQSRSAPRRAMIVRASGRNIAAYDFAYACVPTCASWPSRCLRSPVDQVDSRDRLRRAAIEQPPSRPSRRRRRQSEAKGQIIVAPGRETASARSRCSRASAIFSGEPASQAPRRDGRRRLQANRVSPRRR